MSAGDIAASYLSAAVDTAPTSTDWQRDNDARVGQGYALLAIADAIEASVDKLVAATTPTPTEPQQQTQSEDRDPDMTIVYDPNTYAVVWSAPWQTQPFIEYVPAVFVRAVSDRTLNIRAVTL